MKKKVEMEYELRTRSGNTVWTLISTPMGLMKWLADDIKFDGDKATFSWGDPLREQATHHATILEEAKNKYIRFHWNDTDHDLYWEIKMQKSEIAGNYHLLITDFAEEDEIDDLKLLWNQDIDRLLQITG